MKLIKYSASWCQPCKQLSNSLKQVDLSGITLEEQDIDTLPRLMLQTLGIRGVPLLVLQDDNGNELDRRAGFMQASTIQEWLQNNSSTQEKQP